MNYQEKILERIKHKALWPGFEYQERISSLGGFYDDCFGHGATENKLAGLLLAHQLAEQIIIFLIKSSEFLIQLSIFPNEYTINIPENTTFGKRLEALDNTIRFPKYDEFRTHAGKLNNYRNTIVHKMVKTDSDDEIEDLTDKAEYEFEISI